jgi:RNA-directed DNA polymerase
LKRSGDGTRTDGQVGRREGLMARRDSQSGRSYRANGPEDVRVDWHSVDWAECEDHVRRLRRRIFKATQEGDLKKVRNL